MVMSAFVLIGIGIGMIFDQVTAGTIIGMGAGYLTQIFLKKK